MFCVSKSILGRLLTYINPVAKALSIDSEIRSGLECSHVSMDVIVC